MSVAKESKKHDRPLELGSFLHELEKAGRINKDQLDEVTSQRRTSAQLKSHLLVLIADQNLDDQKNPGQVSKGA